MWQGPLVRGCHVRAECPHFSSNLAESRRCRSRESSPAGLAAWGKRGRAGPGERRRLARRDRVEPAQIKRDPRSGGFAQERGHAAEPDAVDELLLRDAHHVHGHRAGDDLDAHLARHAQPWKSSTDPGSVATTLRVSPRAMGSSAFFALTIGIGHFKPRASQWVSVPTMMTHPPLVSISTRLNGYREARPPLGRRRKVSTGVGAGGPSRTIKDT